MYASCCNLDITIHCTVCTNAALGSGSSHLRLSAHDVLVKLDEEDCPRLRLTLHGHGVRGHTRTFEDTRMRRRGRTRAWPCVSFWKRRRAPDAALRSTVDHCGPWRYRGCSSARGRAPLRTRERGREDSPNPAHASAPRTIPAEKAAQESWPMSRGTEMSLSIAWSSSTSMYSSAALSPFSSASAARPKSVRHTPPCTKATCGGPGAEVRERPVWRDAAGASERWTLRAHTSADGTRTAAGDPRTQVCALSARASALTQRP